jgi:adapter protein MecA 1/2
MPIPRGFFPSLQVAGFVLELGVLIIQLLVFVIKKDLVIGVQIERISENQIKFILSENDLSQRNMRLTELSYGSEKTQELFREVMDRAMLECDFHTHESTPLIIEAIPIPANSIMIIITRVTGKHDLEARLGHPPTFEDFNNFLNAARNMSGIPGMQGALGLGTQGGTISKNPADIFGQTIGQRDAACKNTAGQAIFEFESLDQTIAAVSRISGIYIGSSTLYKYNKKYYLSMDDKHRPLTKSQENILKEYGRKFSALEISKTYLIEHGEIIINKNAIGILSAYLG